MVTGARQLHDLLYLLAEHVSGAAGEKVDHDHYDVAWLKQAQADLGLNEGGAPLRLSQRRS